MTAITPTPIGTDLLTDIRTTIDRVHELEEQVRRVGSGDIADGVITSAHIADGTIQAGDLSFTAVTNPFVGQLQLSTQGNTGGLLIGTDTTLYRSAADTLKTDDAFVAERSLTNTALAAQAPGDTVARFAARSDGSVEFGPGNATRDTNLYRGNTDLLQTDDRFRISFNDTTGPSSPTLYVTNPGASGNPTAIYARTAQNGTNVIIGAGQNSDVAFWGVQGNKQMRFGDGTNAMDTNLYRVGVNQLKTDGQFQAGNGLAVSGGGMTVNRPLGGDSVLYLTVAAEANARFNMSASGVMSWGAGGGSGLDTNLYRQASNSLRTDGGIDVGGSLAVGWNSTGGITNFTGAANTAWRNLLTGADTQAAIQISGDGDMAWGVGGTTAPDTFLSRGGANYLITNGKFGAFNGALVTGSFLNLERTNTGESTLWINKAGDGNYRMHVDNVGVISWGAGTGAGDTNLYRHSSGNVLVTDDAFQAGGDINARVAASSRVAIGSDSGSNPAVMFGSSLDTALYRFSGGTVNHVGLRTEEPFIVGSWFTKNATSIKEYAWNNSATVTVGVQYKLGEFTMPSNSTNINITGEVRVQGSQNVMGSEFRLAVRATTLPTKAFQFQQRQIGLGGTGQTCNVRVWSDAASGRVVLTFEVAGTTGQNWGYDLTVHERGDYNAWEPPTSLATFDSTGLTEITPVWAGDTPLVTSLPTAPLYDGQEVRYVADATNRVIWNLKYNAGSASASKWEFIGGPPLYAEVTTGQSPASTGAYIDLATVGPAITLPVAGDYMVQIGCTVDSVSSQVGKMSYAIGGTAAVDADALVFFDGNGIVSKVTTSRERRKNGLGAVTLTAKYSHGNTPRTFADRWMRVIPVRLG